MPATNAERQVRCRERHLGADGERARIDVFLSAHAKKQLDRLKRHKRDTATGASRKMGRKRGAAGEVNIVGQDTEALLRRRVAQRITDEDASTRPPLHGDARWGGE
jgi:hypothetical protein